MKKTLLFLTACFIVNVTLLAQNWTQVTPASTSTATGITIHNNALFISTQAVSPYRSTDGSNWVQKNNGIVGVESQGGGIGSAGTYIYYGAKGGAGILRSNDDGNTWTATGTGITVAATNFGRFFYEFNGVYYCSMSAAVSSGGGLFRSTDGINWSASTLGGSAGETSYQMTKIGSNLYVTTNLSFYESTDNGVSWTSVATNGAKVYNGLIEFKGRRLVHTTFGMEFSDDNGATWDTLTTSIKSSTYCGFVPGANDTLYTYTASSGVFYSVDTGATWVDITGDLKPNDVLFMNGMQYFNGNLYLATLLAVKSNGQTVTSINELGLNEVNINVYPNPFNNQLLVENKDGLNIHVKLVNITGQVMLNDHTSNKKITLNTKKLSQGIYFLQIINQKNGRVVSSKKIINNK